MSIESAFCKGFPSIVLLLVMHWAQAQIIQSARMELSMSDDVSERYKAIGLAQNGLMAYRRLDGRNTDQIELIKVDTALHENWKGYVEVPKNLVLHRVQHRSEFVFFLFRDRNHGGDFQIEAINLMSGSHRAYMVKNLIPFNPTDFTITDQAAMIGGYYNYRPIVLYFSFATQRSRVLPGFFNAPGELDQLKAYTDGSVDVVVSAKNFEKRRSLWIRNYDAQGTLVKTTILEPEEDKHLIFGRSVKLANGQQIVAGVYGRFTDYSRGIFVANINEAGEYGISYYPFAKLENFFNYMKAKQKQRVKERIERRTIRGKKIKFNYRFLIHDLIPYQNQYIMTGEAFYPHYTYPKAGQFYESRFIPMAYSYGSPIRNELVFDGYQYTHAVVIGFDKGGNLKWDNSFEINDIKTMQLEEFVEVKADKERIVMMYLFENKLRTKIINGADVLEGKSENQIKTSRQGETVDIPNIESEQLDYWYGNYFFAYGVQNLKQPWGATRRAFFVNKIFYR
jgi:hypothetical protein